MREIVFDTETTGLSWSGGDRLVEIGCVELVNKVETGRVFHAYYHPERPMPAEAYAIHGLSDVFLSDKPRFVESVEALLAFLDCAPLVAHNASFDFGFLNGELGRCGHPAICTTRSIDTLQLARTRHPGAKHSLDALCTRYGIDRSHRIVHGALLDAHLLAQVYVEIVGGRQIGLGLVSEMPTLQMVASPVQRIAREPRVFAPSVAELAAHTLFLAGLTDPVWGAPA